MLTYKTNCGVVFHVQKNSRFRDILILNCETIFSFLALLPELSESFIVEAEQNFAATLFRRRQSIYMTE